MSWDNLRSSIKLCDKCEMAATRKNVVIGRGSSQPLVSFIGEAPGEEEDHKGMPFIGRAGQVLDAEIKRIGLSYNEYYIMNACKCRPIDAKFRNRKPTVDEIKNCSQYFDMQIQLLKPRCIVLLGESAKVAFYSSDVPANYSSPVLKFLHPAATLYRPKMYLVLREQFNKLRDMVVKFRAERKKDSLF